MGQAAHDAGGILLDSPGGAGHRPRDKRPLAAAARTQLT
jgi:hypothetical protein